MSQTANPVQGLTRYVAVVEGKEPTDFTGVYWEPWLNVPTADLPDLFVNMIARHHLRLRGGLAPDQTTLTLFVYVTDRPEGDRAVTWHKVVITREP